MQEGCGNMLEGLPPESTTTRQRESLDEWYKKCDCQIQQPTDMLGKSRGGKATIHFPDTILDPGFCTG